MKPDTSDSEDASANAEPAAVDPRLQPCLLEDDSGQSYLLYTPENAGPAAPVLVVVHDISRDAAGLAAAFLDECEARRITLVAPVFEVERYPNYQRLGRSRRSEDRGRFADDALEAIVDDAMRRRGGEGDAVPVHIYGHGAGGRFAMRFAMAHPQRAAAAAFSDAGSYTLPDAERRFPQGIAPGQKRSDLRFEPERFLRVPMTAIEAPSAPADEGGPRLEEVPRDDATTTRRRGRDWVHAMNEAAASAALAPVAVHHTVDEPVDGFDAWYREHELPARVCEALLGPPEGASPRFSFEPETSPSVADDEDPAVEAKSTWERARPFLIPALIAAIVVAISTPIFLWAQYRTTHVISREAVVRSHIADVGSRLDGVVKTVEVDAGDRVVAGQVVATLEASHYEAKVRQARSNLEKATRELEVERLAIENERERLESSLREVSAGLSAASAEAAVSASRVEEAKRRLDLQRSLSQQGLLAVEQVRIAENDLQTARAQQQAASAQRRAALASEDLAKVANEGLAVREKRIAVLESAIASLQAELSVAEANLEGTIIRAPDDGAVVRRIVQPGGSTSVGQPIISLWVGKEIWVEAWLDEDELANVRVGSPATVTFKSYPDREFTGVVEQLGVSTDMELPDSEVPQPRNQRMRNAPIISVRIRLDETDAEFFPGLSAIVGIRKQAG